MDKIGEKYLVPWWFFILALIGAGIVTGVLMFYSADFDARQFEANLLGQRVVNCLVTNGIVEFNSAKEFDVYGACGLSKSVFSPGSNFFFKANLIDETGRSVGSLNGGQSSFEKDCEVGANVEAKSFPKCVKKTLSVGYYENNELKKGFLEVHTASNNFGFRGGAIKP